MMLKSKLNYCVLFIFAFLMMAFVQCDDDLKDESKVDEETNKPLKVVFKPPQIDKSDAFFVSYFKSGSDLENSWIKSEAKKDGVDVNLAKYDGQWSVEVPASSAVEDDYALVLKSKAKHHAVSANLHKEVDFKSEKQLVVQYDVRFQNGIECGGAYVKLLTKDGSSDLKQFRDKSPYTIMFGPDKCGMDHKVHFIFQHKNPVSGKFEEKHAKKPKADLDSYFNDKKTHLYTLVVNADNSFEIYIDKTLVSSGSLLNDFEPSVIPPKEIDDPNDKKPEDWDEREKIVDETAQKPEDWDESQPKKILDSDAVKPEGWLEDEPKLIPDPKAEKPKDWDKEMDGDWAAPQIDNPKCKEAPGCGEWKQPEKDNPLYKGKWAAPMIANPNYKGIWKPRRIENPNYFEDSHPFNGLNTIGAIGLELWQMSDDIAFDNFIITNDKKVADKFAEDTWRIKKDAERKADPKAQSVVDAVSEMTSEKPWIWAVIALVIGLPIALICYLCCRKSGSKPSARHDDALRKKTDETVPDDQEDSEGEEFTSGDGDAPQEVKQGKESLESDSEKEEEEERTESPSNNATTRLRSRRSAKD